MSLLFWNGRGLGNRCTIQEVEIYIRAQDPTALFLAESWAGEARLINLCTELGLINIGFRLKLIVWGV